MIPLIPIKKKWLAAVLFCLLTTGLLQAAEARRTDRWVIQHWTQQAALPHPRVQALALDAAGVLWCGTPAGLARFDGRTFTVSDGRNTAAQPSQSILSLHCHADGRMLAGTDGGGVVQIQNGRMSPLPGAEHLLDGRVSAVISDWQGRIWLGTAYGVYEIERNIATHYGREHGLHDGVITSLALDHNGRVWAGMLRAGLAVHVGESFESIVHPFGRQGVLALAHTPLGVVAGTFQGLWRLPPGQDRVLSVPGLEFTAISAIAEDQADGIWVGTPASGLHHIPFNTEETAQAQAFLETQDIRCLLSNSPDHLWVGTGSDGLFLLRRSRVAQAEISDLKPGTVTTVISGPGALFYGGTSQGEILSFSGRALRSRMALSPEASAVTALTRDARGTLWAGTVSGQIYQSQRNGYHPVENSAQQPLGRINRLLNDGSGMLWIASESGLYFSTRSGVLHQSADWPASDLCLDAQGRLYAAGRDGVFRLINGQWKRIFYEQRIAPTTMVVDFAGRLWVGTRGHGVLCVRDSLVLCRVTEAEGLAGNRIQALGLDDARGLWVGTLSGLCHVSLPDLADSLFTLPVPQLITEADGLPSDLCGGVGLPAIAVLPSGVIPVVTARGLALVDDVFAVADDPVQPPRITVSESKIGLEAGVDPDREGLSIGLSSDNALEAHRYRYRYRVEGAMSGWQMVPAVRAASIALGLLNPGDYRIAAQTLHPSGQASKTAYLQVHVPGRSPAPWGAALVVVLTGLGFWFMRQRKQRLQTRPESGKYKTSALAPEQAQTTLKRLEKLMAVEQLYLEPDLSLKILAKKCRLHPNHLSRVINEHFQVGYNDYINRQRIAHARTLLDASGPERSIQQIMEASGFFSKSVFNTAFKKWSGVTPSQYRRTIQQKG